MTYDDAPADARSPDHSTCAHCGQPISWWDDVCYVHDSSGFADCGIYVSPHPDRPPAGTILIDPIISADQHYAGKHATPIEWSTPVAHPPDSTRAYAEGPDRPSAPSLHTDFVSISQALGRLDQLTIALDEKLVPILGPDFAEETTSQVGLVDPSPDRSPLSTQLDDFRTVLLRIGGRMERLLGRIEL